MADRKVTDEQAHELVQWFMHRMGQDTRRELMAQRPVEYARLTGADPAVITAAVARAITQDRIDHV